MPRGGWFHSVLLNVLSSFLKTSATMLVMRVFSVDGTTLAGASVQDVLQPSFWHELS